MAQSESVDGKFDQFMAQGEKLKLEGAELARYVQQCMDREVRAIEKDKERQHQLLMDKQEKDAEAREAELEKEAETRKAKLEKEAEARKAELEREEKKLEREEKKERAEKELELALIEKEKAIAVAREKAAMAETQKEIELKKLELEQQKIQSGIITADNVADITASSGSGARARSNFPKLPLFHEDRDEIDSFLFRFEAHAQAVGWKTSDWPIIMGTLLQGNALSLYHSMCAAGSFDYKDLKTALLTKFQCSKEGFREKFRSCRPEQDESFQSFYTRLKHLFNRWIEMADIPKEFDDLFDLLISEQILFSVNKELSVFLRERSLKKSQDIIDTAECFRLAHPGKNLSRTAGTGLSAFPVDAQFNQNSNRGSRGGRNRRHRGRGGFNRGGQFRGGFNQSPPQEQQSTDNKTYSRGTFRGRGGIPQRGGDSHTLVCFGCGGEDHIQRDCQVVCKKCGLKGHSSSRCRRNTSDASANVGVEVGSVGIAVGSDDTAVLCSAQGCLSNLPVSKGQVNGIRISVLRDTGASIAGVRKDLVLPHQFLDKRQEVVSFGGQRQVFPLAEVQVSTDFYEGPLICCVIDDPVVDLILGNVQGVAPIPGLVVGHDQSIIAAVVTRSQKKKDEAVPQSLPLHDISDVVSVQELIGLQQNDASLSKFFDLTTSVDQSTRFKFIIRQGVLYRLFSQDREDYSQIVVPTSLRSQVLSVAHDALLAGHCGFKKTLSRVQNRFWWPGVSADTRHFVQTCDVCQKVFPKGRVPDIPLSQMPLIDEPFRRVAIDIVGPLSPLSEEKHRYILTIVDVATRFPEAIPLRSIDSVSVAEALFTVFSRLGFPVEVLSDNGSQFTSDMFREFLKFLQIKAVHSSPYHAQSNGIVERFHGTLKPMLKKTVLDHPRLWHRYLPALLFACRELKNESTGFSPFELLFGRKARGPIDFLADSLTDTDSQSVSRSIFQHVHELKNTISDMSQLAKQSVQEARNTQKFYHDKKSRMRKFKLNDEVLILLPTSSNKLLMTWKGPYKVVECLEFDYLIDVAGKRRIFHPNMLKLYHRRDQPVCSVGVPVSVSSGAAVEFADILSPEFCPDVDAPSDSFSSLETVSLSPDVAFVAVLSEPVPDSVQDTDPSVQTLSSGETFRDVKFDEDLSMKQLVEIQSVFQSHKSILTSDPGLFSLGVQHEVKLYSDKPVFARQYPLPFQALDTIQKEVSTMLDLGVIEPSVSSYSAPVVLVKKPDGSTRFCCDYRMLNKVTVPDAEPIPDHDTLFSQVSSAQYFTKIDLCKGYWQISVAREDRPKTAFQTHLGLFQWVRMPFGLSTAPATFARAMRALNLGPHAVNFFDDILIFSESWAQHLIDVDDVLSKLKLAGFTARPTKIMAGFRQLLFLGHVIGQGSLRPEESKVDKILRIPTPTTKRQVRALLGLLSYYRRYIPDFGAVTAPISDLLGGRAARQICWTPACQSALEKVQILLSNKPVLLLPDFSKPFTVRSDASSVGIGGVLMQEVDHHLHPVSFVSRKLLPRETRYSTIERECLAIIWVLGKFSRYLWGKSFVLQTDHRPLTYLGSSRFKNSRILRWSLALQEFQFSVVPVPGTENVFADLLSRSAVSQSLP